MSIFEDLRAIVLAIVGRRLDHLALYPCRVVSQDGDRLDLAPESDRLAPCAGVPLRFGLPGVTATVPAGTRVLMGFEHGDPSRPYAALWELGQVTTLSVNGGSVGVARNGDDVARSAAMATWMNAVSSELGILSVPTTIGAVSEGSDVLKVP